jgi:hypothetical protein
MPSLFGQLKVNRSYYHVAHKQEASYVNLVSYLLVSVTWEIDMGFMIRGCCALFLPWRR